MFFKSLNLKSNNINLLFYSQFSRGLMFFLPIIALFYQSSVNSIAKVALIFAAGSLAMTIFEVPSGAIADLFGRKNTLLISQGLKIISILILFISTSFVILIIHAIIRSIARGFVSGTDTALMYDTLKEENQEKHYKNIVGKYFAIWAFGAATGSFIGGFLAKISLLAPFIATLIPIVFTTTLVFYMVEPIYKKENHKNIFKQMFQSSKLAFSTKQLTLLMIGGFLIYAFNESLHELNSLFFQFKGIPIVIFGIASAAVFGFSSIGHLTSNYFSKLWGNRNTIIISVSASILFIIIATQTSGYLAIFFYVASSFFFGMRFPIINYLINLEVESSKRATVVSISNLMRFFGLAIASPIIGYWADLYSINTAFLITSLCMLSAVIVYAMLKERK